MDKIVCTLPRRSDLTREAFRDYYENSHAPLALQHMPFARYARSYPVDGGEHGFDVISEFWLEDASAVAGVLGGDAGQVFAEDEARFSDRAGIAPATAEEYVLARPAIALGATRRRKALLLRIDPAHRDQLRGAVFDWASTFGRPGRELLIDFTSSTGAVPFAADAIVWSDPSVSPKPPKAPLTLWKAIEVETCESAAEALVAA